MSHIYRKPETKKPEPVPSVRDMVTSLGDDWRTLVMNDNGYPFKDDAKITGDLREGAAMYYMENGLFPRIDPRDLK